MMSVTPLRSSADTASEAFKRNHAANSALAAELRDKLETAARGGSDRARDRHVSRGKLLPRDRVDTLTDPGSPFLELSPLAADGMYDGDAPAAGIITGVGRVDGRECVIVANDATVKGGTYYPMTVKKHLRAQEVALHNHLPCVYLVDSGGAFLPRQDEVFPDREHFGRIFYNQATMSARGIPQIAAVLGSCTAGGAYVPAMSDEAVIVRNQGTIFLGGPPLVKAATGEVVTAEELGGGDLHSRVSGVTDHLAEDDADALRIVRCIVATLGAASPRAPGTSAPSEEPLYDADEHLRRRPRRPAHPVRRARGHRPDRRRQPVRRVQGGVRRRPWSPGSPGSTATRSASSPTTASCSASPRSRAPTSSSCATSAGSPWSSCRTSPASWSAGSTRPAASPSTAPRWSPRSPARGCPKLTVIIGGSFGAGNYAMCGRAYSPRFLWMWPNARISVMGGDQAASVLATVRRDQLEARGRTGRQRGGGVQEPVREQYEHQGNPYYSTARLWDDGIIDPADTRRVLGLALSAAANAPLEPAGYGVFRM